MVGNLCGETDHTEKKGPANKGKRSVLAGCLDKTWGKMKSAPTRSQKE